MGCFLLNMRDYACMCVYIYIYIHMLYFLNTSHKAGFQLFWLSCSFKPRKKPKKNNIFSQKHPVFPKIHIYIYTLYHTLIHIYIYIKHPPSPLTPRNLVGIAHGNHIQGRIATTTNLRQIHRKAQAFAHPIHLRSSTRRVNDLMVGWPQGICFFGGRWNCWWQPRNPAILKPSWGMVVYLPLFTTGFKN